MGAQSLAGNQLDESDERFQILSPGLRRKIKLQMHRPLLLKVRETTTPNKGATARPSSHLLWSLLSRDRTHITGAGEEEDNGMAHDEHWLRFPYDSTVLRSHHLHPRP
jgi:hypothetical protein